MSERPGVFIHPKAEVHDDCTIGEGTRIWQFASIIRGARLGKDCNVAAGACFDGSVAGDRCILSHNLAAGPGFLLGDDVFIGPNVTLCNDAWPRTYKMNFDPAQFDGTRWAIVIEDGVSIGSGSVILPGVRIGANAMIAANSVVSRSVPPRCLYKGGRYLPMDKAPTRMRFAPSAEEIAARFEAIV